MGTIPALIPEQTRIHNLIIDNRDLFPHHIVMADENYTLIILVDNNGITTFTPKEFEERINYEKQHQAT